MPLPSGALARGRRARGRLAQGGYPNPEPKRRLKRSLVFGGSGYATAPAAVLPTTAPPLSLAGWFLTTTNGGLLSQYNASDVHRSAIETRSGELQYYYSGSHSGAATQTGATQTNGLWHHAALTVGVDGTARIYADGKVSPATQAAPNGWANLPAALANFGGSLLTLASAPRLAGWRCWERELSAAEVFLLATGIAVPLGSLLAEWRFDDQQGLVALDTSGKGQHLTLTLPTWSLDVPALGL